jgi:hypothetical protein
MRASICTHTCTIYFSYEYTPAGKRRKKNEAEADKEAEEAEGDKGEQAGGGDNDEVCVYMSLCVYM